MGWSTSTGVSVLSAGSGSLSMAGSLFGGEGLEIDANSSIYLIAPGKYLGNQLNSYSQFIRISVTPTSATPTMLDHDILLEGDGLTLGARYSQSDAGLSVQLRETVGWVDVATGTAISKSRFKSVLSGLTRLSVSVSFDSDVLLSSVEMGTAMSLSQINSSASDLTEVRHVEECACPSNYTGLSCELCSSGYTRTASGRCELCGCSGLSDDCDPETGACFNCSGSATGPSCEVCVGGTYGDPALGVPCMPCPCPLTTPLGQFTDECVLTSSGDPQCINCPPGHTGECVGGGGERVGGGRVCVSNSILTADDNYPASCFTLLVVVVVSCCCYSELCLVVLSSMA